MPGCLNELSSTRTCGSSRCAASHSVVTSASGRAKAMALLREGDIDAAILPALVLDLADHHPADLGGVADMRAAAGLQIGAAIRAGDVDDPHPPGAGGRLDRHRTHQLGLRVQLRFADPARRDLEPGRNQLAEARPD